MRNSDSPKVVPRIARVGLWLIVALGLFAALPATGQDATLDPASELAGMRTAFAKFYPAGQPESLTAVSTPPAAELPVVKRARYATHLRLPDGTFRAIVTIHAQNYRGTDGFWRPIVEAVTSADPTTGMAYESTENGLVSRFGASVLDSGVRFAAHGAPAVTIRPVALVGRDAAGAIVVARQPLATAAVLQEPRTVTYPGLYPGATDTYTVGADRLKHTLVLQRGALALPAEAAWIGGRYQLALPAGHALTTWDGTPVADTRTTSDGLTITRDGEPVYRIDRVVVTDAVGAEGPGRFTVTIGPAEGEVTLSMETSVAWATDPARVYPLSIDPTIVLQPDPTTGNDTFVRQLVPTKNYGQSGNVTTNYGSTAGALWAILSFDLTSIPSSAIVNSASFDWYHALNSGPGNVLEAYLATSAWTETSVVWNTKPTRNLTAFDSLTYPSGYPAWRTWTGFTATAQNWIDGTTANNGFYVINTTNDYFLLFHRSSDWSTLSERPKFTVNYSTGPAIATPASPGALTDAYELDPYGPEVFTATGGTTPYTWSATGLPTGLTMGTVLNDGQITGTPAAGTAGAYSVSVTVTDATAATDVGTYTLDVYVLPSITGPATLPNGLETIAYGPVAMTGTGGKPAVVWSATGLPAGLTINATTGAISGTPPAGSAGSYPVVVTLTDANGKTDTQAYTLVIDPPTPTITSPAAGPLPDAYEGTVYGPLTFTGAGGVTPYTWTAAPLPLGLTMTTVADDGSLGGTPSAGAAGNYAVVVTLTDANTSTDVANYTLDVYAPPTITAPAGLPNGAETVVYGPVGLTATGGKGTLTFSAVGLPPSLSINSATGVISGTPDAGTAGSYTVIVTVTDANTVTGNRNYGLTIATPSSPNAGGGGSSGGGGCFVVTASGASPEGSLGLTDLLGEYRLSTAGAGDIALLREFRRTQLMGSAAGKGAVAAYQTAGPYAAAAIQDRAAGQGFAHLLVVLPARVVALATTGEFGQFRARDLLGVLLLGLYALGFLALFWRRRRLAVVHD